MQDYEKRCQIGTGGVGKGHDKGNDSVSKTQPVAPCFSCFRWNDCGGFLWNNCVRFGLFVRDCKAARWEEIRRAKECD